VGGGTAGRDKIFAPGLYAFHGFHDHERKEINNSKAHQELIIFDDPNLFPKI
jgi:hypothetical protein